MDKPFGDADSMFRMVRQFHAVAGLPIASAPSQLDPGRLSARVEWLREEVAELASATSLVEQLDATLDVLYLALGNLVEMGVTVMPGFGAVHRANLGKQWPDGAFRTDGDGKLLKPPGWCGPEGDLQRLVDSPSVED